jgi:hypothetical protein
MPNADDRKYVRVYYNDLIRDYPDVWADNDQLATWLRLLATADPMWPTPPELPRSVKPRVLGRLVDSSLVTTIADKRYRMKGLDAERTMRGDKARSAAAMRWHSKGTSDGNAEAMPKRERAETSRDEPTARDGLPSLDHDAIAALEDRTGQIWSQAGEKQLGEYDRLVGTHGLVKVIAAFDAVSRGTKMTARQLIWPALRILEPFPDLAVVEKEDDAEHAAIATRRSVENTQRRLHENGAHQDEPRPNCPSCQGVAS